MPAVRVFNSKIPRFAWPRLHIHLEEESQGVSALNSHSHKYLWLIGPAVPPFSVPDVARYWATDRLRVYFFSIFLARYVDQEIVLVAPENVWNDVFRPHCTCMWARLCARLAVTRFFFCNCLFLLCWIRPGKQDCRHSVFKPRDRGRFSRWNRWVRR